MFSKSLLLFSIFANFLEKPMTAIGYMKYCTMQEIHVQTNAKNIGLQTCEARLSSTKR